MSLHNISPPAGGVREGAAELGAKFKSDISRVARFRRAISLRPMVGCLECDATGRVPCSSCEGTGKTKVVFNDKIENCPTCEGKGTITCIECAGRGRVVNKHRKKIIWLFSLGALAWAFVLYRLWGGDVLPEQVAHVKGGGGQSAGHAVRSAAPRTPRVGEARPNP